jgi:hypothetical protein
VFSASDTARDSDDDGEGDDGDAWSDVGGDMAGVLSGEYQVTLADGKLGVTVDEAPAQYRSHGSGANLWPEPLSAAAAAGGVDADTPARKAKEGVGKGGKWIAKKLSSVGKKLKDADQGREGEQPQQQDGARAEDPQQQQPQQLLLPAAALVTHVLGGEQADRAGLRAGSEVLMIGSTRVVGVGFLDVLAMLKAAPRPVTLQLWHRDGKNNAACVCPAAAATAPESEPEPEPSEPVVVATAVAMAEPEPGPALSADIDMSDL